MYTVNYKNQKKRSIDWRLCVMLRDAG